MCVCVCVTVCMFVCGDQGLLSIKIRVIVHMFPPRLALDMSSKGA